jgi:hypothetical protein
MRSNDGDTDECGSEGVEGRRGDCGAERDIVTAVFVL